MKKKYLSFLCAGLCLMVSLAGCGFEKSVTEDGAATATSKENENIAKTGNDLFYDFLDSKIPAISVYEGTEREVWFKDLPQNNGEWDDYSVSDEKIDLDNDGETELILNGPYGGMYLDARDGKVYVLAEGEGTAGELGHVEYEGKMYITHRDVSHGGRQVYWFYQYDGTGTIVDSFNLSAEYFDAEYDHYDSDSNFTFKGQNITMEEYEKLMKEILDHPTKVELGESMAAYEFESYGDGDLVMNDGSDTFYDAMDAFYGEYTYKSSSDGLDGELYLIQELDNSREYSIYESNTDGFRFIGLGSDVEYIKGHRLYMKFPETDDEGKTKGYKYYILCDHDYHMFLFETDENYENPVYIYTAWYKY